MNKPQITYFVLMITSYKDIARFQIRKQESASSTNGKRSTQVKPQVQGIQMGHNMAFKKLFQCPFVSAEQINIISFSGFFASAPSIYTVEARTKLAHQLSWAAGPRRFSHERRATPPQSTTSTAWLREHPSTSAARRKFRIILTGFEHSACPPRCQVRQLGSSTSYCRLTSCRRWCGYASC